MADGILSFPFRVTLQGSAAVTPHGSDQEVEEALAVLTLTLAGERPMEPDFGIPDPVWGSITLNDIETGIADYGPAGISITGLEEHQMSETDAAYTVFWTRDPDEQENT